MILDELAIPEDLATAGAWVPVSDMPPLAFRVRPLWNDDFRRLHDRLVAQVPRGRLVGGRLPPEDDARILSECLWRTVLVDWRGLAWSPGESVPYSPETARDFMFKPEYARIRALVIDAADHVEERWTA